MSLVGKFFLHSGKNYYQTGEIVDSFGPDSGYFLVRFEPGNGVPPQLELFWIGIFVSSIDNDGCPNSEWQFFETRKDLEKYKQWLDTPLEETGPKIVKLHS